MRQCLTSPEGGYYTSRGSEGTEVFGRRGDFVTSPEISQMFGELLGVWIVTEWMAQGRRTSGVQLIEVGPGRGTLMADMLRVSSTGSPSCMVYRPQDGLMQYTLVCSKLQEFRFEYRGDLPCGG